MAGKLRYLRLERVRELDASLNGTFKDADCTINENTLTIELLHGGLNLLEKRHTDRAISETVLEWFSVPVTVTFTGKTELQNGDESVIERLHVEEEKRARAAAIEEMERYEAAMKEIAAKRRVSVREGKSLMPQIVLETARPGSRQAAEKGAGADFRSDHRSRTYHRLGRGVRH